MRTSRVYALLFVVALLSVTAACDKNGPHSFAFAGAADPNDPNNQTDGGTTIGPDGGVIGDGSLSNADVFARLAPSCAGCHGGVADPARGYFVSLTAFENLLAYNSAYVLPGDAANSRLLKMLGAADPVPMPPAPGDAFSVMAQNGDTYITMAELTTWINNLEAGVIVDNEDVPVLRRKTTEQIVTALQSQLGLQESDFFSTDGNATYLLDNASYAVRSPDALIFANPFDQGGALFMALGGPYYLEGKGRHNVIDQTFLQALTQVSQAWCRLSATKAGATFNTVVGQGGDEVTVRANISTQYLRMLGAVSSPAEVDDLWQLFSTYAARDVETGWVSVCAALVRDPLWLTY